MCYFLKESNRESTSEPQLSLGLVLEFWLSTDLPTQKHLGSGIIQNHAINNNPVGNLRGYLPHNSIEQIRNKGQMEMTRPR